MWSLLLIVLPQQHHVIRLLKKLAGGAVAEVLRVDEVLHYIIENDFVLGKSGARKGNQFSGGRKDD